MKKTIYESQGGRMERDIRVLVPRPQTKSLSGPPSTPGPAVGQPIFLRAMRDSLAGRARHISIRLQTRSIPNELPGMNALRIGSPKMARIRFYRIWFSGTGDTTNLRSCKTKFESLGSQNLLSRSSNKTEFGTSTIQEQSCGGDWLTVLPSELRKRSSRSIARAAGKYLD